MPDAQRAEIAKLEALHAEHPQGRIFTHLAEAYRKEGELELAREVLLEGIQRHPDYSSAHVVLARVLADMGEEEGAVAEFRRVLELDSHNLVALRRLADMARAGGRHDEALDYYHRLLDVEPSDEEVREIVEAVQRGEPAPGEAEPALAEVEGGWSLDTDEGEPAAAAPDADEDEPWVLGDEPEAQDLVGEPERDTGDEQGEEEELGLPSLSADEEAGVMTETIAQVYARQGLYDRAAEVYRQLVRSRPDDAALRTRLEEMEALAAAPSAGDEEPGAGTEPIFEGDFQEPADHDVEPGPIPGLVTGGLDAPPDVTPLAGLENDDIDPDTGLLAMDGEDVPALEGIPERSVENVPPPPEEEAPWGAESEADEEPWAARVAEDEPWSAAAEAEERTEQIESEAEHVESVWTGAEGASAGNESPYAWSEEAEEPVDESEPIGSYLRSLLGWGGDEAPSPGSTAPPAEQAGSGREGAEGADVAESSRPGRPGAPAGDASADDDDLDTFRSWLESLKQ